MARTQSPDYDDRRQSILDNSASLFADKGFHATSVAEIARSCGASKSRLYHYFGSKEDMLQAVMEDHITLLAEIARNISNSPDSAEKQLARISHEFMAAYVGARDRHVVLLNEIANLPEPSRKKIVGLQREIVGIIGQILAAINPAAFRDAARAWPITMLFMGMLNWTHVWYDPEGPLKREEFAEILTRMTLTGVKSLI